MRSSKTLTLLLLTALLTLPGCGLFSSSGDSGDSGPSSSRYGNDSVGKGDANISGYTPDSLANYQLGRNYAASGRYELAREHYLIALAASNSQEMQEALAQELNSIDMMIKSLR